MMKLLHVILHNPFDSLLVVFAAFFILSLILCDLEDRRLKRELLAARLRARTLYQRQRMQNQQQLEWETPPTVPNIGFLPGNGRLGGPFNIFRWRWVFLSTIALVMITMVRNNEASNSPAPAHSNQDAAKEIPSAQVPDIATDENATIPRDANYPALYNLTLKFDYDHTNLFEERTSAITFEPVSGDSVLPGEELDRFGDGKVDSDIAAAWVTGKPFSFSNRLPNKK